MYIQDFIYDGLSLSSLGYMPCSFSGADMETVASGTEISFKTVSTRHGLKNELVSYGYDSAVQSNPIQICKNPCDGSDMKITVDEARELARWLNRPTFHKAKFVNVNQDESDICFNGSFNISRIENAGIIIGFELTFVADTPYAFGDTETITKAMPKNSAVYFMSHSDEEGELYPKTTITLQENGNLDIYNESADCHTYIANCKSGEVITLDYPMITTSLQSHKIQNDFNWNFFVLSRGFQAAENKVTSTLKCTITIEYEPIIKLSI